MGSVADTSPRQLARIAGAQYLINIVAGVRHRLRSQHLVVPDDAAATASNIQTHELLYRSGLAAHVVVTVTNVPLAVIFYDLFKVVNRRLASLDACCILWRPPSKRPASSTSPHHCSCWAADRTGSALPAAQLQPLAYLSSDLSGIAYDVHTVFFGCDAICIAYLILRSTFVPGAIGVLMAYLLYSFADLLAPGFAGQLVPWIQLPALIGEGSLCLWLLLVGVDVERWRARAQVGMHAEGLACAGGHAPSSS